MKTIDRIIDKVSKAGVWIGAFLMLFLIIRSLF